MARYARTLDAVYRVRLAWGDQVSYYGPYTTVGAARSMLTRKMNYYNQFHQRFGPLGLPKPGIEKMSAPWEEVD